MRRFIIVLFVLLFGTIFALVVITGEPRVQQALGVWLSRALRSVSQLPIQVAWVYWNPVVGSITLGDTVLIGPEGDAIAEAPLIEAQIKWGSFRWNGIEFDEVVVHGLRTAVHVDAEYNAKPIDWIIERLAASAQTWTTEAETPKLDSDFYFGLHRIRFQNADLGFSMEEPYMQARIRDADLVLYLKGLQLKSFDIDCRAAYYQVLDWRWDDITIKGAAYLTESALDFRDLLVNIGYPPLDAQVQMSIPFDEPNLYISLDIEAQIDTSEVNVHYTSIPELIGTADAAVRIDVYVDRGIELKANVHADALSVQGQYVRDFFTAAFLNEDGMRFDRIRGQTQQGEFSGAGLISWYPDIWLKFGLHLTNIDLDYARGYLKDDLPLQPQGAFSGQVDFRFDIEPRYQLDLSGVGELNLRSAALAPGALMPPQHVQTAFAMRLDNNSIMLMPVRFTGAQFSGQLTAAIYYDQNPVLYSLAGSAVVNHLASLGLNHYIDLLGSAKGNFTLSNDRLNVDFTAAPLRIEQTQWQRGTGSLSLQAAKLHVTNVALQQGNGLLRGGLTLDGVDLLASFTVQDLDIASVIEHSDLTGVLSGNMNIDKQGKALAPEVTGQLTLSAAKLGGLSLGDLHYQAVRRDNLIVGHLSSSLGSQLTVQHDARLAAVVASGKLHLGLEPRWAQLMEFSSVAAGLTIFALGQEFSLSALISDLGASQAGSTAGLSAVLTWQNDGGSLVAYKTGEKVSGRLSIEHSQANRQTQIAGALAFIDPFLPPEVPLTTARGRLWIDAQIADSDWRSLSGNLYVADVKAMLGQISVSQQQLAELRAVKGIFDLPQPLNLTLADQGNLSIFGGGILGDSWNLQLSAAAPLAMLVPLKVGLREATGTLRAEANVKGAWLEPQLEGRGRFSAERLAFAELNQPIDAAAGQLIFNNRSLLLQNLVGRFGDGTIKGSGKIGLLANERGQIVLDLQVDSERIRIGSYLSTGVNGHLTLLGKLDEQPLVVGSLNLHSLVYDEDIAWERALLRARNRAVVELQDQERSPRLDVTLQGRRNLELRTNLLRGTFATHLDVRGTLAQPVYAGYVELAPGSEFFFRGNTYQLRRGSVQMQDGANNTPFLDIEAATFVRYRSDSLQPEVTYRILLFILGPADQLQIRFESDPPLEEADILTLLSLGVLASELTDQGYGGIEGGSLEISSILLNAQISRLEREIQSLIGFDRIEIEPAFNNSEGSSSMQITLQKQIAKKLTLSLGTALNVNADQRVELGYRVSKGFDFSVGWDSNQNIGNFFARPRFVVPLP